jgi:hypothetical protein
LLEFPVIFSGGLPFLNFVASFEKYILW